MKRIHLYLWILGILLIAVGVCWVYRSEGFQVNTPQQIPASFWALSEKVDNNDEDTLNKLERVTDPDPSDPNDIMPLTFSKYISMYAMAKYNNDVSGARLALFNNYNQLQSEMSSTLYAQSERSRWTQDPLTQSCNQLSNLKITFLSEYATAVNAVQDLSGTSVTASRMRDENLKYQNQIISKCQDSPLSANCIKLANQEGPLFPLLAKYENVNNNIFTAELDISNNLQTVNYVIDILNCPPANQFFKGSTTTFWVNNNVKYQVDPSRVGCTACDSTYPGQNISSKMCGTAPGPYPTSDAILNRIPTGPLFTCAFIGESIRNPSGMTDPYRGQPMFRSAQTGTVDTTILLSKLQTLSPYYLSPDTLQYITTSIISAADSTAAITTTSDILVNINNVVSNIKSITGTR